MLREVEQMDPHKRTENGEYVHMKKFIALLSAVAVLFHQMLREAAGT